MRDSISDKSSTLFSIVCGDAEINSDFSKIATD